MGMYGNRQAIMIKYATEPKEGTCLLETQEQGVWNIRCVVVEYAMNEKEMPGRPVKRI